MKHGIPILELALEDETQAGITFPTDHGLISEIECREAAVFGNYNYTQFLKLTPQERASCIAHYRMHSIIEAHVRQSAKYTSENNQRRASRKQRFPV